MRIDWSMLKQYAWLSEEKLAKSPVSQIVPFAYRDGFELSGPMQNVAIRGVLHTHDKAIEKWNQKIVGETSEVDKSLVLLDKTFAEIGRTLEEMNTLAIMAQDEKLSDTDRIDMQVQMTKLQTKLFKAAHRMGLNIMGGKAEQTEQTLDAIMYTEHEMLAILYDTRERIESGELVSGWDGVDAADLRRNPALQRSSGIIAQDIYIPGNAIDRDIALDEYEAQCSKPRDESLGVSEDEPLPGVYIPDLSLDGVNSIGTRREQQASPTPALPRSVTVVSFLGGAGDRGLSEAERKAAKDATTTLYSGTVITNTKSAKESMKRIQTQIETLSELKEEFKNFYQNMPAEGYSTEGKEEIHFFWGEWQKYAIPGAVVFDDSGRQDYVIPGDAETSPDGTPLLYTDGKPVIGPGSFGTREEAFLKIYGQSEDAYNANLHPAEESAAWPTAQTAKEGVSYDMRIKNPRTPLEAFLKKMDAIFKDEIYASLGYYKGGSAPRKN